MLGSAMEELDAVWDEMLSAAAHNPPDAQAAVVNEFLELKNANDRIRSTAVEWLFGTARELAEHANRKQAGINVEAQDAHRFSYQNAFLSGSLVRFRQGVRCLTLEAGWTHRPSDAFMRGNALAVARLTHFGKAKENAELHLLKFEDRPRWFKVGDGRLRISFELADLIRHFQVFLG